MLCIFVNGTLTTEHKPAQTTDAESREALLRAIDHCTEKVMRICAEGSPTPREQLQVGYNLGRLAELTGLGRRVWDETKEAWEGGRYFDVATKAAEFRLLWKLRLTPAG